MSNPPSPTGITELDREEIEDYAGNKYILEYLRFPRIYDFRVSTISAYLRFPRIYDFRVSTLNLYFAVKHWTVSFHHKMRIAVAVFK